jgi:cytochrome c-type biogenesis protein CcmH
MRSGVATVISSWTGRPVRFIACLVTVAVFSFTPFVGEALAQSAKSSLDDPAQATLFNEISDQLVCQCGCNMILRVCNHFECPSAIPMRAKIEEQILAGETPDAIVAGFVDEYGQVVLATPPPTGINLAAWIMPGFALLMGLFIVLYFVADWLAKKKVKPAVTAALDPEMTARIEKELQGLDG